MLLEELNDVTIVINSIKVKKASAYIFSNDLKIKLKASTIEQFDLKVGMELTPETIEQMKKYELKVDALHYLKSIISKKPYTEIQLISKCSKKIKNAQIAKEALNELKKQKIIGDSDYIQSYVDYFNDHNFGKYYILDYLTAQGIEKDKINEIEFDESFEIEKAWNYFGSIKNKYIGTNFAKQKKKIYDSMLRRGFGMQIINDVISNLEINEEDENTKLLKAYKKAKAKYEEKFQGYKLRNKIVAKLITQGYTYEKIVDVIGEESEDYYVD